jgi:Tol biopolymer transport system component
VNVSFRVGEFLIEPQLNSISINGEATRVEPKVMQVLVCLTSAAGEVVSKERLIQSVWTNTFVGDDVLSRAVSELRKVFGDDSKEPRYIQTIPRSGYRLIAPVSHNHIEPDTKLQMAQTAIPNTRSWSQQLIWPVFLLLLTSGAAWLYLSQRRSEARPAMRVVPLTSFPGREDQAAISPDGNQIAFAWGGEKGDNGDIYVKSINGDRPLRITSDPALDFLPAWSPDGQRICFVRYSHDEGTFTVFVVSALGTTPERMLFSLTHMPANLAWSPDGKFIATSDSPPGSKASSIVLFSPESGEKRNLTTPPGNYWADSTPAFSPDSRSVAFVRENTPVTGDIYIVPITGGEPRRVTYDNARHVFESGIVGGLSWTADGTELIFSSTRGGTASLWRVAAVGGEPERLAVGGDSTYSPSVSLQGHRLVYMKVSGGTPVYRVEVASSKRQGVAPTRFLSSTREDASPRYSPNGKRIAFQSDRSGNPEIWMCDSDGQNLSQLTSFRKGVAGTPQWAPDSSQIAFDYRATGTSDIYVINVAGGVPRRVTNESSDDSVPSWSRDGRYLYFASNRGGDLQIWKTAVDGGQAWQLTKQGGFTAFESADGKYLYYSKVGVPGVWRRPLDGGPEVLVLNRPGAGEWGQWALADDGIYFINSKAEAGNTVELFSFATQDVTQVVSLGYALEFVSGLAVSPDRHQILYTKQDPLNSDIMLVEDFR